MLKLASALGFRNVVGMNGSEFIFLDLIFKIVSEVVGRKFGSPRKSVILQFIFVVGENGRIKFGTADCDVKFISVKVRVGVGIADNFMNGRALKFVDGHSVAQVEKIVRIGMKRNNIA